MKPKMILKLLLLALALPITALTSCNNGDTNKAAAKPEAVEAKHHYTVTMTGIT